MNKLYRLKYLILLFALSSVVFVSAIIQHDDNYSISLIILDPGHFHAALIQKNPYNTVNPNVHVYAPNGPDVQSYLSLVDGYNTRIDNPTHWKEATYLGDDYFEKMLTEKPGNVVILAGNNKKKTEYIGKSVAAGLNVLADKPVVLNSDGFDQLKKAFDVADKKKVIVYDMMTERYSIISILQKVLSHTPEIFGSLQKGTLDNPGIIKKSVHNFFKSVSGKPALRPSWYFDVDQQGDGMVDVTTHLIDLVEWQCFPETVFNYQQDIQILAAKRWPTDISKSQFKLLTGTNEYPDYLKKDIFDNTLKVYANGEINYAIKGVHTRVAVQWDFKTADGHGDVFYAMMRGTKANLIIKQGKEENYKQALYIAPNDTSSVYKNNLLKAFMGIQAQYPGVELSKAGSVWQVIIPEKYKIPHEEQFMKVAEKFITYIKAGKLPAWETSAMLTKYYTTTQALAKAKL